MASIISDTELLELSIEPFEDDMQIREEETSINKNKDIPQSSNEPQKQ